MVCVLLQKGRPVNVGLAITSAMQEKVKKLAESIQVRTDARLVDLKVRNGACLGVSYRTSTGEEHLVESDSVILTTGGFSTDREVRCLFVLFFASLSHFCLLLFLHFTRACCGSMHLT